MMEEEGHVPKSKKEEDEGWETVSEEDTNK